MIKNNIEADVKVKCMENGLMQVQLVKTIKTTGQYANRIIKKLNWMGLLVRRLYRGLSFLGMILN